MDNNLTDLLTPPEGEQVTFLNIQKFISPHYLKVAEAAVEAAEAVAEAAEAVAETVEAVTKKTKRPTVRKAKA
jgi:histone H3/H4